MSDTAKRQAAIYVRETTRLGPDGADAQTQMAEAHEYCRTKGLEVAAWYTDGLNKRNEFHKLMDDATGREPTFNHVVVWKLMYFAPMLEESVLSRDKLKKNGIRLLSVRERVPEG